MATPSVAWKDISHRANRFRKGCWSKDRIRLIWEEAGSPERITAPVVAMVGLSNLGLGSLAEQLPIRYILRWCVGLMSVEQAKGLFKKLRLPPNFLHRRIGS